MDDEEGKLLTVLRYGVCIAIRKEDGKNIMLYQMSEFYVEVFKSDIEEGMFQFRSFSSLEPLEPYLNDIDISRLVK